MASLEELKAERSRLLAKKSFESFVSERAREKSKLKSEIFALKHPNVVGRVEMAKGRIKNIPYHVKGRFNMAKEKLKKLGEAQKKSQKGKKSQGFQGINFRAITG